MCPWLPEAFFHRLVGHWSELVGEPYYLEANLLASGPSEIEYAHGTDPFTSGMADAGIICAPTYIWGSRLVPPRVKLAGYTPVFEEVTAPVFHSIVLARKDLPANGLEDLNSAKWGFNDPCSLSGYMSVTSSLQDRGARIRKRAIFTGGHQQSVELLLAGAIDCCAVDSNGWLLQPDLRERVLEVAREVCRLGPFVAQPLVLSASIPDRRQERLKSSLKALVEDESFLSDLRQEFGLKWFVPTRESHFEDLKTRIR